MRKLPLLLVLAAPVLLAQSVAPQAVNTAHLQDWTIDLGGGWRVHNGDNPAWARPNFDVSTWQSADLDNLGASEPGWHWYRFHVKLARRPR